MSTYRLKDGFDQALNDLIVVTPQPRSPGILATRTTHAADGAIYREGLYVPWIYNVLEDSQWTALLTAFGLAYDSAHTNDVTIYTLNNARSFVRLNGTITIPELGREADRDFGFWRNVTFVIKDLSTPA